MTRETLSRILPAGRVGLDLRTRRRPRRRRTAPRTRAPSRAARGRRPRIGFVPHYPAHDWYRSMEKAMRARAEELGLDLVVAAPQAGIAQEIRSIRRVIARAAARLIAPGDTILINQGEACVFLAEELKPATDLTVVTNSLDVLERLSGRAGRQGDPDQRRAPFQIRGVWSVRASAPCSRRCASTRRSSPSTASRPASARRPATSGWRSPRAASSMHRARFTCSPITRWSARRPTTGSLPLDQIDEVITDTGSLPARPPCFRFRRHERLPGGRGDRGERRAADLSACLDRSPREKGRA